MTTYDREILKALKDGTLEFDQMKEMQSNHKDANRFFELLSIAQQSVPWDDKILIPYAEHLYVVEKENKSRIVKCFCGHEFGPVEQNWKLEAIVYVRDTEEKMNEIYPKMLSANPDWMELREFFCPECAILLEVEAVPPGYPIVFDFQPDIDGFYEKWLNKPLKN